jgi:hypothetical protein
MHGFHPFPFFPFILFFLLTSTGQTGKPIFMVEGSNNALPSEEVPFWGLLGRVSLFGVNIPKAAKKRAWSMVSEPNSET